MLYMALLCIELKCKTIYLFQIAYETLHLNDDVSADECILCLTRIEKAQNKCVGYNRTQRKPGTISQQGRGALRNMIQASPQCNMIHKLPTEKKSQNLNEHQIFPVGPSIIAHVVKRKILMDRYKDMLPFYRKKFKPGGFSQL